MLGQTEDLGDVQHVASPVAAHAHLGVGGVQDLVPVDLEVHEAVVEVVGVWPRAHVVAHLLPVLDAGLDVGVVVRAPGGGHLRGVLLGQGDEVRRHGQRAQAPAGALLVDVGGEGGLGLARALLGGVGRPGKPHKNGDPEQDNPN